MYLYVYIYMYIYTLCTIIQYPLKMELWEGVGSGIPFMNFSFFARFWLFDATGKGKDKWPKMAKTSFSPKPFIFFSCHNQAPDSTTVPLSCALGPLVALPRRARKHNQKKNRVSKHIWKEACKSGRCMYRWKTMKTTFVKLFIRDLLCFWFGHEPWIFKWNWEPRGGPPPPYSSRPRGCTIYFPIAHDCAISTERNIMWYILFTT